VSQPVSVVICDDSRLARKQMASVLRGWNVEVTFAEHGLEGLEAVRAGKGDILFLDLTMPIMDGYQVLERIRKDDLPTMVIVISGDVQAEARERVLALGALEFIRKPTTSEDIAEVLNRFGLLTELEGTTAPSVEAEAEIDLPEYYKEIANVAMGQAGEMLARLLNTFVHLPIPIVSMVDPQSLQDRLMTAKDSEYELVSQGFIGGGVAGEAFLLLEKSNLDKVATLMDLHDGGEFRTSELLMSLSNALIGAFLTSFSKQIDIVFSKATPHILRDFIGFNEQAEHWDKSLMITIDYQMNEHDTQCELMLVFTQDSLVKLQNIASYFS
jgi:CheY-like chemotaxis protein|tara:strand:- start:5384 stop:6364 length:981 start_codon:yes stop_codon:yes gene_type:complete